MLERSAPTHGDPILIDQCTSLVSNGQIKAFDGADRLPGRWLKDNRGRPSDDPADLKASRPATIMALGGEEFGYKGFGFGLMVEAFALALSGHGRLTHKDRGSQGVFLQLIDPAAFSGSGAFLDETSDLVRRCKESRPADGSPGVRMPGERAMSEKRRQLTDGLDVDAGVWARLSTLGQRYDVPEFAA